jgi:hypothetical protein
MNKEEQRKHTKIRTKNASFTRSCKSIEFKEPSLLDELERDGV